MAGGPIKFPVLCALLLCLSYLGVGIARGTLQEDADGAEIDRGREIAEAYWDARGKSCWSAATVVWSELPETVTGEAPLGGCRDVRSKATIVLDRSLQGAPWDQLCSTIVHEYGHLVGEEHSDDPGDVMYPQGTLSNVPEECARSSSQV